MFIRDTQVGSSSFWRNDQYDNLLKDSMTKRQADTYNLYKLAANKRAISNFVTILTNKNIPVQFIPRGGNSYTDGKTITISSKIDTPEDFDVACGLALHEASHILLSDFNLLQSLSATLVNKGVSQSEQFRYAEQNNLNPTYLIKTFLNVVEDRRIDQYIFKTAPGYRNYYRKMYEKYFYDRVITKALKTNEYTSETVNSYKFRIINIHVPESRLDALEGLQEIYDLIDLSNIDRLKNSHDALDVAIKIFYVVMDNVMGNTEESEDEEVKETFNLPGSDFDGDGTSPSVETDPDSDVSQEQDEEEDTDEDEPDDDSDALEEDEEEQTEVVTTIESSDDQEDDQDSDQEDDEDETEEEDEDVELTDRQKVIIEKRLSKQEDFVHNDVRKRMIEKNDLNIVEIIEETDSTIETVGSDSEFIETFRAKNIPVVLVKKMTDNLVDSDSFPLKASLHTRNKLESAVQEGVKLGTRLASKLQVRSESRDTIYNKQKTGKLDKRMLSSLGYGASNVFYRKDVDEYNDVNLHLSIDASGSMYRMWSEVITNAVCLAKACSIIPNINIQISFRTNTDNRNSDRTMPYVLIAYDSRVDSFSHVLNFFNKIDCGNLTPEGLCFEAIENYIVDSSNGLDSIFLNISDGCPNYGNGSIRYSGHDAATHTRKQVNRMLRRNIKVLSYFIDHDSSPSSYQHRIFDASYGPAAKYIDVTSVQQISKTMNKVFLEK